MPTTVMDAKTLYECDADFRALLGVWEKAMEPPLPLIDLLMERDLPQQADGVRWVLEQPKRDYSSVALTVSRRLHPFPWRTSDSPYGWSWWSDGNKADGLHITVFQRLKGTGNLDYRCYKTCADALTNLLDAFGDGV